MLEEIIMPYQNIEKRKKRQREYARKRYVSDPEYRKKKNQPRPERYQKLRKEILNLLGNKCSKCNFSDFRALEIDHVRNNGSEERKNWNVFPFLCHVLKEVKKGSEDYQLLCANCNRIKEWERREEKGKGV